MDVTCSCKTWHYLIFSSLHHLSGRLDSKLSVLASTQSQSVLSATLYSSKSSVGDKLCDTRDAGMFGMFRFAVAVFIVFEGPFLLLTLSNAAF